MVKDLTLKARQFCSHWQSLRNGPAIPKLPDYLDKPMNELQPRVVIVDVEDPRLQPVRLVGTGIVNFFGFDATSANFLDTVADGIRSIFARCHQDIPRIPCGKIHTSVCSTSTGRELIVPAIALPLLRRDEKPSVIWLLEVGETLGFGETGSEVRDIREEWWIDIGFGAPDPSVTLASLLPAA